VGNCPLENQTSSNSNFTLGSSKLGCQGERGPKRGKKPKQKSQAVPRTGINRKRLAEALARGEKDRHSEEGGFNSKKQ